MPRRPALFDRPLLALLGVVLLSRVAVLAVFGVQDMPDSSGYWEYADYILATPDWSSRAGYLFRMVGFPLLIAGLKSVSADHWRLLLGAVQTLMTLGALVALYHAARSLGLSRRRAVAIGAGYGFSVVFFLDTVVLTDSLHAGLLVIAVSLLILQCSAPGSARAGSFAAAFAAVGILLALAFLLRENTVYLLAPLLPLLALAAWRVAGRRSLLVSGACVLLALLPLLATLTVIQDWNERRTGERFVTTGARTVYTYALMKPYLTLFPEIFSGDTPLDRAFRRYVREDRFGDIVALNAALKRDYGWSETEIVRKARDKYLRTLAANPLVGLYIVVRNIKPSTFLGLFQPALSVGQMLSVSEGNFRYWRARFLAREILFDGRFSLVPSFLLMAAESLLSLALFAVFVFVVPYRFFRTAGRQGVRRTVAGGWGVVATLWLLYAGFWLIHALVNIEPRYLAGANVAVLLSGAYALRDRALLPSRIRGFLAR